MKRTQKTTDYGGRRRQQTEDNCRERPDSSEAPNSSRQRKRRLMRLNSSTRRAVKPKQRTDGAFEETTHWLESDVKQQHVLPHVRDAKRQAHPRPSGERHSHISVLLISLRGRTVLAHWVQLWADRRLDPAFTEPLLQAKLIGRDKRRRQGQANSI